VIYTRVHFQFCNNREMLSYFKSLASGVDPDAVGMVGGLGPGIGLLNCGGDRRREGAVLAGEKFGTYIVTNGKFE